MKFIQGSRPQILVVMVVNVVAVHLVEVLTSTGPLLKFGSPQACFTLKCNLLKLNNVE